ncbi:hypothetical protein GEMRC1_006825 [Eukaryota sp. GEM-RC1]
MTNVGSSPLSITISFINTCLGAGVVASASAFRSQGVLLGGITNILYLIISIIAFNWIIESGDHRRKYSFQALLLDVFPKNRSYGIGMNITVLLYAWFCILTYAVIISSSLPSLLIWVFPSINGKWFVSGHVCLVIIATVVLLPLSLQKTVGALAYASSTAALVAVYMAIYGIYAMFQTNVNDISFLDPETEQGEVYLFKFETFFVGVGLYGFMYAAHVGAFGLYKALRDRSVASFRRIIIVAFSCIGTVLTVIGISYYLLIGDSVRGNFLENLDSSRSGVLLANFLLFSLVTVSFPILALYVRDSIADLFFNDTKMDKVEGEQGVALPEIIQTRIPKSYSRSSFIDAEHVDEFSETDRLTDHTDDDENVSLSDVDIDTDALRRSLDKKREESHTPSILDIDETTIDIQPIPAAAEEEVDHSLDLGKTDGFTYEAALEEYSKPEATGTDRLTSKQRVLVTLGIVYFTVFVALLVPDVLIVFSFSGSLVASIIVFVFPAFVRLYCGLPVTKLTKSMCIFSIVVGCMTAAVGTTQAVQDLF